VLVLVARRPDADVAGQHRVGRARQAPSSSAAAADSPSSCDPSSATSPIVTGIAINSSRMVELHARHDSGRSSFRPAENRAMMSAISVRCSSAPASAIGSTQAMPEPLMAMAAAQPSAR
jgi:hypothetical protein